MPPSARAARHPVGAGSGGGGQQVVVIGASVGGLLAAAAAAAGGHVVTLLERDELPHAPVPRAGAPQGAQPHVFLYRGLLAIEDLLPGLRAELTALGAVAFDTGDLPWLGENGWFPNGLPAYEVVSLTRPLFEHALRRRVTALPQVSIRTGTRVTELRPDGRRWQVELADASTVVVDLVIDASGRTSRLPVWLAAADISPAATSEVDAGVGYATQLLAAAPATFDAVGLVIQQTPGTLAGGLALPVEGGRWLVSAIGCAGNRPPRDVAGFTAFLDALPDPALAALVRGGQPLGGVTVHRQTGNRRHHYEAVREWPDGLLAIGDALCAFNPIYGQGIAVAASEALLLRNVLAGPLRPGYCRRLQKAFGTVVALPWAIATSEDLRYPSSKGHQAPAQLLLGRWTRHLGRLAAHGDHRAYSVVSRVYHLMGSPVLLFHPALLAAAVRARLRGYGPPAPRPRRLDALSR